MTAAFKKSPDYFLNHVSYERGYQVKGQNPFKSLDIENLQIALQKDESTQDHEHEHYF